MTNNLQTETLKSLVCVVALHLRPLSRFR